MVGLAGLEPATPRLSSVCSNQLSYRPLLRQGYEGQALSELVVVGSCFAARGLPFIALRSVNEEGRRMVEACGFEPQTFCLQSRRSTN